MDVFRPAEGLMSRLPYNFKFLLISVLFLCPLLLLSFQLWGQLERDLQTTANEVAGVSLIQELNQVTATAAELRDLSMAYNYDRTPQTAALISRLRTSTRQQLDQFINAHSESRLLQSEQLDRLQQARQEAFREDLGAKLMLREYMNSYGSLVQALDHVAYEVANLSGLANDRDPQVATDLELYLDSVRPLLARLTQLRGYGNNTLNMQYLDSATFTEVDASYYHTQTGLAEFQRALEKITGETPDHPLVAAQGEFTQAIEQLLYLFNDQVVEAISERLGWQQFNARASALIDTARNLEQGILERTLNAVQQRLAQKQRNRLILVISLLALLVLIGYLYAGLYLSLDRSIDNMVGSTHQVAQGDMTVAAARLTRDEFAVLVDNFNRMVQQMRQLILAARDSSDTVTQHATHVKALADRNSDIVRRQTAETAKISHAMEEMCAAAEAIARETELTADGAREADANARQGQQLVEAAVTNFNALSDNMAHSTQVVEQLAEQSQGVTDILTVIRNIAEQTNLLALNAAIEAARAGEQGRGFAVVADEVRTLAQRSQEATEDINQVLGKIQAGVQEAVNAMELSGEVTARSVNTANDLTAKLEEILQGVSHISARTQSISAASLQQTQTVSQVLASIKSINGRSQEAASGADDTQQSSQQMLSALEQMLAQLSRFRT
ncbi:MAG: methyl-accepting chemotaxis protein [Pseudomonadota bacterium]|nr:methyl-accepting chemotaxis protein [Pseudomonadota bacterium]